jgi:hypothetical protein
MNSAPTKNSLASLSFPRTGKRGVPQQFPRRLYEMLDGETKLLAASADHPKVISWSDSGKAFRIYDVAEFAASVLPKYFRTKKFSSFQRNLNLVSHLSLSVTVVVAKAEAFPTLFEYFPTFYLTHYSLSSISTALQKSAADRKPTCMPTRPSCATIPSC